MTVKPISMMAPLRKNSDMTHSSKGASKGAMCAGLAPGEARGPVEASEPSNDRHKALNEG